MSCMIPEFYEPATTIPPVQWTRWLEPGATHLSQITTFATGGKIRTVVTAHSEQDIIETVSAADNANIPLLMVGGGSNILAGSSDFDGIVMRDGRQQIETVCEEGCPGARIHVTAGTPWDAVVAYAVEHGWMGIEALSGIPGTTGAAIVQNIGAYGQEIAGTVVSARTWDRATRSVRTIFMSDMELGYRTSLLKQSMRASSNNYVSNPRRRIDVGTQIFGPSPRWIVLDVDFQFRLASLSEPVRYGPLAAELGIQPGDRAASVDVRAAVLKLRRSKGMVLDDADRDTYSAGSFFINPVLSEASAAALPADAPRFAVTDPSAVNQIGAAAPRVPGVVKTSAAWLIAHAGFAPGYAMPGPAALSTKHSLALTNRGDATGEHIADLAKEIRDGVLDCFGVELEPEPVLIGLSL